MKPCQPKISKKVYKQFCQYFYTIYPGQCILCLTQSHRQFDLCHYCEEELPHINRACQHCGIALPKATLELPKAILKLPKALHVTPSTLQSMPICGQCITKPPHFNHCITAFEYKHPINLLISQFKYQHKLLYGKILAELLANKILNNPIQSRPDLLIPVPLHWKRHYQRGFNQAAFIAKIISKKTGVPVNHKLCKRIRNTPPQVGLDKNYRSKNMKNAFNLRASTKINSVAIIDDVITTGSTVNELSQTLLTSEIKNVMVWAIARTI